MIIDSDLTHHAARMQNPHFPCPDPIFRLQTVVAIRYWSFDGKIHKGQLVVDRRLAPEVTEIFRIIEDARFPVAHMIPAADPRFSWDDGRLMQDNVTSCFNYRTIDGTDRLSHHAYGQAIDVNPLLNPCIHDNGKVEPRGAVWNPSRPGTILPDSIVVETFLSFGWKWGGHWKTPKDYQHFQKQLS